MSSVYVYTARSAEGAPVTGSISAQSADDALAHLRTRSLFVTALQSSESRGGALLSVMSAFSTSQSAKVAFFRSFATLIGSGVPMRRALLVTVEECRSARLAEALRSIIADIESGASLSGSMARRPRDFSPLFVAMIKAGEIGGALADVLERLAELMERDRALRKRVAAALAYPSIVSLTAAGLVVFLLANTVPAFAAMFDEMHVTLPLTTRIFIAIGEAAKSPVVILGMLVVPIAGYCCLRSAARNVRFAEGLDRLKLALPLFGAIVRKSTVARFARTLSTLLRSGVSLTTSLEASGDAVDSAVYARCVKALGESLKGGDPLTVPLERSRLFDPLFLQLVRVGEETGQLDSMLLRVANYYELDVETAVTTLGTVLEPLLIIALGAIVGTIVASVLIPLYSVIGSIK
ncbi:MAG: type II secretion system F family protein [Candidatus Eremiobacteraeota bacterium]|nr:type II secretion system F family protein [Candidatus Eremiobacteraeota bacterium]